MLANMKTTITWGDVLGCLPILRIDYQIGDRFDQLLGRQLTQLQLDGVSVGDRLRGVPVLVAKHGHRDHGHAMVDCLEHAQETRMGDERFDVFMTWNRDGFMWFDWMIGFAAYLNESNNLYVYL